MATSTIVSRPSARTTITSSTSSYTGIIVTTTVQQVVPSTTGSTTVGDGSQAFPTAAIVIIAVVAGIIAFFIAYKIYAWDYRRRHAHEIDLPETRRKSSGAFGGSTTMLPSMGYAKSPSGGVLGETQYASARRASALGLAGMARPSSTMFGSEKELLADEEALHPGSDPTSPTNSSSGQVGSLMTSPFGSSSASLLQQPGGTMSTAQSRASFSSASRLSLYGAGTTTPTSRSGNRLSGVPHAPHSRIDIVPPTPLAPPPGSVVATDKAKLDFAPSSGIGAREPSEEWFNPALAATSPAAHAFPPNGSGAGRPVRRTFGGPGSSSTSSTASSPHRYPSPSTSHQALPPQPAQQRGTESPPRSYTPRSTHTHSSSHSSLQSQQQQQQPNSQRSPFGSSPLEQLQQRFAHEAAQLDK